MDADTVLMGLMKKPKISISWSGGKDSALAFYKLTEAGQYQVKEMHTVFNADNKRVGMHGIPYALIKRQVSVLSIPHKALYLDADKTINAYEKLMIDHYKRLAAEGISHVMFGDIFLEDLKEFRDTILEKCGLQGVYPLWKKESGDLLQEFMNLGFASIMCAAEAEKLPKEFVGKPLSEDLLRLDIDPCGENGEYHSFVTQNPMFDSVIDVSVKGIYEKEYEYEVLDASGEKVVHKSSFWFADLY